MPYSIWCKQSCLKACACLYSLDFIAPCTLKTKEVYDSKLRASFMRRRVKKVFPRALLRALGTDSEGETQKARAERKKVPPILCKTLYYTWFHVQWSHREIQKSFCSPAKQRSQRVLFMFTQRVYLFIIFVSKCEKQARAFIRWNFRMIWRPQKKCGSGFLKEN